MTRILTCIACPLGCQITATVSDGIVTSVTGNTCPRGKEYAESECTHPMRTLTTTMLCENGTLLPVKTSKPIPKEHIFDAMKIINAKVATLPISVGDVLITDVYGSDVVATQRKSS